MRPLLRVRGLTHSFGAHRVLDAIDLDVNEGEIVGLIGPNGSGKTTFFHCVSGFYRVRFRWIPARGRANSSGCRRTGSGISVSRGPSRPGRFSAGGRSSRIS